MTRTTIRKTDARTVKLTAADPFTGEAIEREFWVPMGGGYVREGERQVCKNLDRLGPTLMAEDTDDLLRVIRHEWRGFRRAERRAFEPFEPGF